MTLTLRHYSALTFAALCLCFGSVHAQDEILAEAQTTKLRITTVADGLVHPWGMVFLPNGDMLVTERAGTLRRVTPEGEKGPAIEGLPTIVSRGQGGLLDVTLDPDFDDNRWVYVAFSEPGDGGTSTAVARGQLDGNQLNNVQVIFSQQPKVQSDGHFGSRLVFADDGTLFITLGDRQQSYEAADAQDLGSHIGTVVRIYPDGRVPASNPFVGDDNALPEIWSYGHRNIQGADLHPTTRELWTGEHGPQGGDEINRTRAGENYGWPIITYGVHYGGATILDGKTHAEGMEQPIFYWTPSIANAGMTFYTGDKFPQWQNNLLVTGLRSRLLSRLVVEGDRVIHEERLLHDELGLRLRDIVQGPDDFLYLLTDERDGKILRMEPAN
ncbi:PQQ-dependent sugar dehydrogenase [Marinimicrobium sp. ABcell2]|uniref:PQQ-dependent sugar dehydrogenase n=1 Tax=Marinimicrobium sp. ABcell2 TaxID=3069751 RepID=UPI0027B81C23|nr:PQQ-dependent sugar dehydrogenase [Marinimicrobium sp. ABcell2]MDQ2076003.1 PQQ-dependent sugar dehydrogenase [Marinimicrobium sp. ABcell2]